MAFVQVPKDLSKVKNKIIFGLTLRQIITFSLAGILGFSVYFKLMDTSPDLAMLMMFLISGPLFMFGIYERDGQKLENVVKNYIKFQFINPKVRRYQTNNFYSFLERFDPKGGNNVAKKGKRPISKVKQRKKGNKTKKQ